MEEAVFIKCEPEWLPEAEDISNFQPNVEPPVSELVEIKVDPDLMLPNPDIEEDNLGVAIEEHRYQTDSPDDLGRSHDWVLVADR
ncbi:uncharacterized protein [Anabrus simplex]|uniref:uncharacterized protein isoform X6 n=1 Tax=Anabrus simplex TaxID=316456 RepID=UPI0035A307B5